MSQITQAKRSQLEIAAILTTLAELNTGSPESVLYMALGSDLNHWQELKAAMLGAGLIESA